MRIAIVGGGVSGLVAARTLHPRHEITLFEADERLGGHSHTVDVELDGELHAVDTGFIVYNETTYPEFSRILGGLGVETRPTDMSFSVRCPERNLEWASPSLGTVFAQRRNLLRAPFRRMLRDILRFNREALRLMEWSEEKASLAEYLEGGGYSREFLDWYVVPMGAAIWSANPDTFLEFPAARFARFFANHGLLERGSPIRWRTVAGGSRSYVRALVAPFRDRVRTGCPVRAIRRHGVGVELRTAHGPEAFDRVVLATHSDQALALLEDPSAAERAVLGALRYRANEVVLHTDASLLPRRRRARASWNYRLDAANPAGAAVTYDMNRLQSIRSSRPLLVTLNPGDAVDPHRVLRRFRYDHPVFDGPAVAAQKLLARIDGQRGTHFCGAWRRYGFHEDGVQAALETCRLLEAEA